MWGLSREKVKEISGVMEMFYINTHMHTFLWYWDLNSRPHVCYAGALPLEALHQCVLYLDWDIGTLGYQFHKQIHLSKPSKLYT
jgi:hypothetical protein